MSAAAAAASAASKYDDAACNVCKGSHDDANMLLCDCCDGAFHAGCLGLPAVPAGDWFCPRCIREGAVNNHGTGYEAPTSSKSVWFYTRVSSAGQNAPQYGRVGMDAQNSTLLAFATQHGCVVNGTVREVCSARNPDDLTELAKLVKRVKRGDIILVTAADRFSRNLAKGMDLVRQIHAKGAAVFAIAEGMYSTDVRFPAALERAQAFSDALSAKMCATVAGIRARGGFVGSVAPYGSRIVRDATGLRKLVNDDDEQRFIKTVRSYRLAFSNAKTIAAKLNENGYRRRGALWTTATVSNVLDN